MPKRLAGKLDFSDRQDLLLHTYDSFLAAQTRLFTIGNFAYDYLSAEIKRKQELLLLDDILYFSISARKLIELTALKSFANRQFIPLQCFDSREHPATLAPSGERIGFLTFVNNAVHSNFLQIIRTRLDFPGVRMDDVSLYRLLERLRRENLWSEYAVDTSIMMASEENRGCVVRIKDLVATSIHVAEKVIDTCGDAGIHLELDMRGSG